MRLLLPVLLLFPLLAHAGGGPENVLVIVNDDSSESLAIAHYYMQRRDIPRHHIVHLTLQPSQWKMMRSFDEYKSLVEDPVRAWLKAHPKARITTMVICRDVPITAPMAKPVNFTPQGKRKTPPDFYKSVAHLLATMKATRASCRDAMVTSLVGIRAGKWRTSPYYRTNQSIDVARPLAADMPLYCVGALNAFSVADVKRMIDNAIDAEADPPRKGTVYLGRSKAGDPRGGYNGVFPQLKRHFEQNSFRCEIVPWDKSRSLLTEKHDVLFFMFGQATWDATFPAKNTYLSGAVVDNLTSFALRTSCFDPKAKGGQTSMCHFLAAGASAVHGCVREPYTIAFDPYHTHMVRYLAGYNLIESFYMSHRLMPWMNLVAGDPLMQPFVKRPTVEEVGFRKTDKGFEWEVKAKAADQLLTISELRCYVDGVLVKTLDAASGTFALPGFDPAVNRVQVIAVDSSPVRAQGRLARTPTALAGDATKVRFTGIVGGKARFDLGGKSGYRWFAPGAKVTHGRGQGATLDLELADSPGALRNTVEIWLDGGGKTARVAYFDMDRAVVDEALKTIERGIKSGAYAEAIRALDLLDRLQLDAASRARAVGWRTEISAKARKEWDALSSKLPRLLRPQHIEKLRAFVAKFDGLQVAAQARARMKASVEKLDAQAAPMLDKAKKYHDRQKWTAAIAAYQALIRKYPASTHAITAKQAVASIKANPDAKGALDAGKRNAAAERMWKMAENYRRNNQDALRQQTLRKLVDKYADTPAGKKAREVLENN